MRIDTEVDLRTWVRRAAAAEGIGPLWWVEPARGSTTGLPDVAVWYRGTGWVWVELKVVRAGADPGLVRALRPEQKARLRDCAQLGIPAGCLVAEAESVGRIFALSAQEWVRGVTWPEGERVVKTGENALKRFKRHAAIPAP